MKHTVEVMAPKNMQQFKTKIQNVWDSLGPEDLVNYIESMPMRLQKCIETEGATINI